MHTHTTFSPCSSLDIHELINIAGTIGLDGICVTDHHTMAGQHAVGEGVQPNGVVVIFGMEYTTTDGDFLIFGPFADIPEKMAAGALLNYVRNNGGAAVAAHPFRKGNAMSEYLVHSGLLDAVESINGRNSDLDNFKAHRFTKQYRVIETGGSDAHSSDEVGNAATFFSVPVFSRKDLVSALKTGLCKPVEPSFEFFRAMSC